MPSVVSEASVSSHRAHHSAKQASGSSKGSKQPSGFEALLDTTAPESAPDKAPPADKSDKTERAAPAKSANETNNDADGQPVDTVAADPQTDAAPDATVPTDGTTAKPVAEIDLTTLPAATDTLPDPSQTEKPDETATVVAAVVVQPAPLPVVAPVIAPVAIVATAPAAAEDTTTTDIPLAGVKPAGETAPAEPMKAAPQTAPAETAAPDQIPQDIKPQTDKPSAEKIAADKPAPDKIKTQPVADENAADTADTKDKDGSLAEKKAAPTEIAANAKPDAPAKPKVDADTARNELDLTPREHAAKSNADATPTATLSTTQAQAPSSTATIAPASQTQQTALAVPVAGLAVEIAAQARAGKNRFEIRLDPPELGRINVRLDMDKDGNVTSRMTVDRPETLDLLRRDAQQLERTLNQAGLKTADNALQFELRDQGFAHNDNNRRGERDAPQLIIPDDQSPVLDAARGYGRLLGLGNGLDISV